LKWYEVNEMSKTKEQKNNEIEILKRQIKQDEKSLEFNERMLSASNRLMAFIEQNNSLIDGKPKYMLMQEYLDLMLEQQKINHEAQVRQFKDVIQTFKEHNQAREKRILELHRNIDNPINEGEVVKNE